MLTFKLIQKKFQFSSLFVLLITISFFLTNVALIECNTDNTLNEDLDYENQIPPPFHQPSHEEVKNELLTLFKEADKNSDSLIDIEEMKDWIEKANQEIIKESFERQWNYYEPHIQEVHNWEDYNKAEKEVVIWEKYKNKTYSDDTSQKTDNESDHSNNLKLMLKRAERRWKVADKNNDTYLTKEEFKDFVHPEESDRQEVKDVLIIEASEDMDKNKNGLISLEEYMNHILSIGDEEKNDQEWIQVQQNHFSNYLDKNKDGILDEQELKEWLVPAYNKHELESSRLIYQSDQNHDKKLSEKEMIDNLNEFTNLIPPSFWAKYMPNDLYKTDQLSHDEL